MPDDCTSYLTFFLFWNATWGGFKATSEDSSIYIFRRRFLWMKMHSMMHILHLYRFFWNHIFISFTFWELADRWGFARAVHLLKNTGLRRQAVSHLQHPSGPAEVSRLLSVSEAKVWSVDMEEISLTDEEGGRLSLLFTAAPALREAMKNGYNEKKEPATQRQYDKRSPYPYENDINVYKYRTAMKEESLWMESMDYSIWCVLLGCFLLLWLLCVSFSLVEFKRAQSQISMCVVWR